MFSKIKNEKIADLLFANDVVSSTPSFNQEFIRVVSVASYIAEYSSDKLGSGAYTNSCIVLEMNHDKVHKNFFVHIFEGAQRREQEVHLVKISFKEEFSTLNTLYKEEDRLRDCISSKEVKILTEIEDGFQWHWFDNEESLYEEDSGCVYYICDQMKEMEVDDKILAMAKQYVAEKFISSPTKRVDFDSFIDGTADETNSDVYLIYLNDCDVKSKMQTEVIELVQLLNKAREI